ncbi:hypothetical protein AQUCO_00300038v1 [Aquilegia coerulea]|uniref:Metallothionein-like protein n=1 Tax=Aquilegia coerulea TaxID=218851 RepID=A0A2G5EWZ1_AQUCA|nr:hypothetical protein AQUCO_00300038v1 [Aquilegia coerulea]
MGVCVCVFRQKRLKYNLDGQDGPQSFYMFRWEFVHILKMHAAFWLMWCMYNCISNSFFLLLIFDVVASRCGMYPDLAEGTTSRTLLLGVAPAAKAFYEGSEMGVGAEGGCKCGDKCTCDPCSCK